jgi:glycosyltransferase involved in cell wall biosynthesis
MPLNVLHLRASTGFGGAENIILSICRNLDPQRFRLSILSTFPDRYENSFLAAAAQRLGIPHDTLRYSHRFSPATVRDFLRHLQRHRIDIVHAHGYRENILAGFAVVFKNVAAVSTTHGWIADIGRKNLDLWALRPLHRILAVSPSIEQEILAAGINRSKVVLLANAVDVTQFRKQAADRALREKFGIQNGEFVIGTAARLSPEKAIEDLVRAVHVVAKRCSHIKCLIAGDGPSREALEKLVADLGLKNIVRFAGYQEDVAAFYNAIDLYASPSLQEEMPKSILEAAASEKPIVATAVGGVPQIIKPGETGVLVPSGQPQRLAEEIVKLVQTPALGERYGKQARLLVSANFSETEAMKKLEKIYEEVFEEIRRKRRR